MALVGYARVSTGGQSLEVQLRALAECNKVFQEKVSGASDDRPQLTLLLDYVKEGDMVMVTKLDRLARNTRHLLEISEFLQQKQVALRILNLGIDTSTPTGKLMLTMIGAIATFERELMLERQAEGIELAKRRGVYKGRKPTAMAKGNEVMALVAKGLPRAEIAKRTGISISSVQRILRSQSN
ncbi:recombinase family protein [Aeromonas hydrophila]|uniref:recombinase family protein n=1 Tax=Aeromonas hydrophila TaxID=644 RepID=UPI001B3A693F|nr:recombinase family protein [Aeromonas hydrophila]MBQ4676514.1 helix-turn-helix domain-containing protein [Aeromonas hydrophila]MBW3813119.1 helix-turn-helix domain-containing protein [Aeromonas hydrophila]MCF7678352.1 recombinase family protein [Aeromonas hydrophila]MCF7691400.1 recombinase family protein [Aeromonas hydrophila]MCF7774130.1 recombinase family protein [Aeromonas hydrophila]